jgi:Protein of unknown function (DUF2852)
MAVILLILGFMWWWPLGLVILAILIASGRLGCWHRPMFAGSGPMGCWNHGMSRWENKMQRMQEKMERVRAKMDTVRGGNMWGAPPSSGNRAFDDYRTETLKRLEDEQREFRDFLDRLRFAKDKTEFDQFMADRRSRGDNAGPQPQSP